MTDGKIITFNKSPELKHTSGVKTNATEGEPFENCWEYFNHPSGNFRSGIWDCSAGAWYHEHPQTEFCYIVEGAVKIQEKDGPLHEYKAGDSFVVPMGTPVTWIVDDYCKKLFVGAKKLDD
ncbi:MAG: cupin domain-containing protein [Desulfobacterales bacterium]|nr:cupin domain-containing protein [Desulfobacterales bacterium]